MFFLDSANMSEIDLILSRGLVSGITTNPTILMKENPDNPLEHLTNIVKKIREYGKNIPLSVQVMTENTQFMIDEAKYLQDYLDYDNLVIKIPIGWDELKVIYELSKQNISVNCTCCMTEIQVSLAANAGADYASIFYGKTSDSGIDPKILVKNSVKYLNNSKTSCKLIVGSLRTDWVITEIIRENADIVTVPAKFFKSLVSNDKTKEAISLFAENYPKKDWL